jgi:uncharacterized FlaG/YvyC family protein
MVEEAEAIGSLGAVDSAPTYDHAPATPASTPGAQDIHDAVNQINSRLSSIDRVLELNVDAGSGLTVATIRDSQTGVVIEQFPGTDSIHLAQMLADWSSGKNVLLDLIA